MTTVEGPPGSRVAPLGVTELNERADALLRGGVGAVWVEGELSRFVAHRSGHWYFSLKDDRSSVSCAMFRGRNRTVRFTPEDGLEVALLATPGVYAVAGRYQLVVEALEPRGRGAAALALEQLRARLAAEGLFDAERKRPLPLLPRRIGVVTSADGAALRDVLRVLRRRFAGVSVLVAPATVQGAEAPRSIVEALATVDARGLDVLLLVRGGGAREDLAAFDDETVVRAVAACVTPIVTGVGHEIDTTLADLAADVRAPTPSAAAEIVVRERDELRRRVGSSRRALAQASRHLLERLRSRLLAAKGSRGLGSVPVSVQRRRMHVADLARRLERGVAAALGDRRVRLDALRRRMAPEELKARVVARRHALERALRTAESLVRRRLAAEQARLARDAARLDALSPLGVLERGYAIVTREDAGGPLVEDASTLGRGDLIHVRLRRGAVAADVRETMPPPSAPREARGRESE